MNSVSHSIKNTSIYSFDPLSRLSNDKDDNSGILSSLLLLLLE